MTLDLIKSSVEVTSVPKQAGSEFRMAGCYVEGSMTLLDIGAAVLNRRKQLGLRQQDLADLAAVSRRLIVDLEAGSLQRDPGVRKLLDICRVLGLTLTVG